ncbi:MAG: hypothetical protein H6577_12905 [Lewinellaceae bacterium]|nr:hypothetical protein [Lewinellaceae bacterium]
MTSCVKYPAALAAIFLWIGFVCAISFMEAWLKFRAPGITLPLGLGIGRLVFNALNKMEWLFLLVIASNLLIAKGLGWNMQNILVAVPFALLAVQTLWLLPVLDARAGLHIQGQEVPASNLHFYNVGMELVKVACLGWAGLLHLKA